VITKPMSPGSLYDRLAWIAFNPRQFVDAPTYFGPDRRFKIEGYPNGIGRRKGDKAVEIGEEAGPALAQGDIDSLFSAVQTGQDS
jgi:two-component system, chemotaxis family, chemotaxis protein CheY